MKTIDEIRQLKKQFLEEYRDAFKAVGNNLAVGIGLDQVTGENTIIANLTNDKLKSSLPDNYHGAKVVIEVVGIIYAQ